MIPSLVDMAVEPPDAAGDPPGFARLRRVLGGATKLPDDIVRKRVAGTVRMAINSSAFERATLNPVVPAIFRLARLAALQSLVGGTDLLERDRLDAQLEIDRAALRVLWSERIVETVLESGARAETRAAALLSLVARGAIPAGGASRALLDPAKALLSSKEAHEALTASPNLRTQMLDLLAAAQAGGAKAA